MNTLHRACGLALGLWCAGAAQALSIRTVDVRGDHQVPVCFQIGSPTTGRALMRSAAEFTWVAETGLVLTGWDTCTTANPWRTIEVRHETLLLPHAIGNYIAINFGSASLRATFAHELGHSLAFMHEQARRTSTCSIQQVLEYPGWNEVGGGTNFGDYDRLSVMNYCGLLRDQDVVSPTDSAGAGAYYGRQQVVAAASWGPGRVDAFAVEVGRSVYGSAPQRLMHWWSNDHGATWDLETFTDGTLTSAVSVVAPAPGRLVLFGRGDDGGIYMKRYDGGGWQSWVQLHPTYTEGMPVAVVRPDGSLVVIGREGRAVQGTLLNRPRLFAIVVGADGSIGSPSYDLSVFPTYDAAATPSIAALMREPVGTPAVAVLGSDVHVLTVRRNGTVRHLRLAPSGPGSLHWAADDPVSIGGVAPGPAMVASGGRLESVFRRVSDGAVVHGSFHPSTGWSFATVGGVTFGRPALVSYAPGRLDLFVRGAGGGVFHNARPPGGSWAGYTDLQGQIHGSPAAVVPPVAAGQSPVGLMTLVAGLSRTLYVRRWTGPDGWSDYQDLGGSGVR